MKMNWFQKDYHNTIAVSVNDFQIALREESEKAPKTITYSLDFNYWDEKIEATMDKIVDEGMSRFNIKNLLIILHDFFTSITTFETFVATDEARKYLSKMIAKFSRLYAEIQMALHRYYERELEDA